MSTETFLARLWNTHIDTCCKRTLRWALATSNASYFWPVVLCTDRGRWWHWSVFASSRENCKVLICSVRSTPRKFPVIIKTRWPVCCRLRFTTELILTFRTSIPTDLLQNSCITCVTMFPIGLSGLVASNLWRKKFLAVESVAVSLALAKTVLSWRRFATTNRAQTSIFCCWGD